MKIEVNLALNNIKKNKKRTLYTTISLILCTTLILTTIILISSIRNGVSENFNSEYNDYHIILHELSPERFNAIKNKTYIDKIYIQKSENEPLEIVDKSYTPKKNIIVYLKYDNIKNVCKYSNDIIGSLKLSEMEAKLIYKICSFNNQLLTVNGFIDVTAQFNSKGLPDCRMRVNYSYVIDLLIIITIIAISVFFIIILYNAFLITINERKKEYAVLNSVGGTEGQILKMVYTEAILMGIISLIIGGVLAVLATNIILNSLNSILSSAGYYFRLMVDIKYIILSIIIIAINIYLSVLIPSIKASSTSVIQGIRNNKQIKYKRRNTILEKILPIEGRVAIKNVKRNKSKYRTITILLVISITAFIAASTYLKYEKETADIVTVYDVDANIDHMLENYVENKEYVNILNEYKNRYNKKLEYFEYRDIPSKYFLVQPKESIITDVRSVVGTQVDGEKIIKIRVIALDNNTYNQYIEETNANYGDFIIYNSIALMNEDENSQTHSYTYEPAFKKDISLKLSLVDGKHTLDGETDIWYYNIMESKILAGTYVLTDEIIDGFKELKIYPTATLFMNMETYKKIDNYLEKIDFFWGNDNNLSVKIECDDVIEFKNFMDEVIEKRNLGLYVEYYSLENQEKNLYINTIELILKVMLGAIIGISIISIINITNASLIERKEDFNVLYRMGATKGNIKKILVYECVHIFIKATIISVLISIPIIYKIIEQMENVIKLNKLLIPYGEIAIFIAIMFLISLAITMFSTRMIKEE